MKWSASVFISAAAPLCVEEIFVGFSDEDDEIQGFGERVRQEGSGYAEPGRSPQAGRA